MNGIILLAFPILAAKCRGTTIFDSNLIVRRNALGDSRISDSSRDFIFGDLDEDRDGVISAEELKEVDAYLLPLRFPSLSLVRGGDGRVPAGRGDRDQRRREQYSAAAGRQPGPRAAAGGPDQVLDEHR